VRRTIPDFFWSKHSSAQRHRGFKLQQSTHYWFVLLSLLGASLPPVSTMDGMLLGHTLSDINGWSVHFAKQDIARNSMENRIIVMAHGPFLTRYIQVH